MDTTERPRRLALSCAPSERGSHRVRAAIEEHCRDRVAPDVLRDVQLVASELVTNALEHGAREVVTLDVVVDGSTATLTVTSTGSSTGIPHPGLWKFPEPTQVTGRGLALTRAMSRSVELHTAVPLFESDWVAITACLGPADSTVVAGTEAAA